jgi:HSP20 family protein
MGKRQQDDQPMAEQPEHADEPPVDVIDEGTSVRIVADVPGVSLDDLALVVEKRRVSISTKDTARRSYQKELELDTDIDPASIRTSCRNGVLEVYLEKKPHKARRKRGK